MTFNPTTDTNKQIARDIQSVSRKAKQLQSRLDDLITRCAYAEEKGVEYFAAHNDTGLTEGFMAHDAAHIEFLLGQIKGLFDAREMYTHPEAEI